MGFDDRALLKICLLIPAIGVGAVAVVAIVAVICTGRLTRGLFLGVIAFAYSSIGIATFDPWAENLRFNDLAAEYIVHWTIVGAVMIPAAWLIGKLARARSC
jgi:hypothetical protein